MTRRDRIPDGGIDAGRPAACDCSPGVDGVDNDLPCFACYLAGYDLPNPEVVR